MIRRKWFCEQNKDVIDDILDGDDPDASAGGGSGDDLDGEDSDSDTGTFEVDGEKFSKEDIKRMREREHNLLIDYHSKTEKLAQEKRELEERQKQFEAREQGLKAREQEILAKADALEKAKEKDLEFFRTHSAEEVQGYTSEVSKLLGGRDLETKKEVMAELKPIVDGLKNELEELRRSRETDKASGLLNYVDRLKAKKYPYADTEKVRAQIYVQFNRTGRLPSEDEVDLMARNSNQVILDAATEVAKGITKKGAFPDATEVEVPKFSKNNPVPDLMDIDAARKAGQKFLDYGALKRQGS